MAEKARTPSSVFDRHPRLSMAGVLLVSYVVNTALFFGIYDVWPGLDDGPHTTRHLAFALIVAFFGNSALFFRRRRESRIGLSTFQDWWIVSR